MRLVAAQVRVAAPQAAVVAHARPAEAGRGQGLVRLGWLHPAAQQGGALAPLGPGRVRFEPAGKGVEQGLQRARAGQGLGGGGAQVARAGAPLQLGLAPEHQHRAQLADGVAQAEQAARLEQLGAGPARDQHHLEPGAARGQQRLGGGEGRPAVEVGQERPAAADQGAVDVREQHDRVEPVEHRPRGGQGQGAHGQALDPAASALRRCR